MKKGISTVIATLLMLVITIALAGFAYTYLSGTVQSRTSVVLDFVESTCNGDPIFVTVRNDGQTQSGAITVSGTQPDGSTSAGPDCTIGSVNPGTQGSCSINRGAGATAGTYRVRASASGAAPVSGVVFCATAGV